MQASQHDNDLVSRVGGFADKAGVVAGLSGLHVADNKSASVPRPFTGRILKLRKDFIGRQVEGVESYPRDPRFHVLGITLPVSPTFLPFRMEPGDMAISAGERGVLAHRTA